MKEKKKMKMKHKTIQEKDEEIEKGNIKLKKEI